MRRARGYAPDSIRCRSRRPSRCSRSAVTSRTRPASCWAIAPTSPPTWATSRPTRASGRFGRRRALRARCSGCAPRSIAHDLHPALCIDALCAGAQGPAARGRAAPRRARARRGRRAPPRRARCSASCSTAPASGPDGTAWGGELLRVDGRGGRARRASARSPCPAASARSARCGASALAALRDAFGPEAERDRGAPRPLRRHHRRRAPHHRAHAGHRGEHGARAGDGALVRRGRRARARPARGAGFEGQVAIALEEAADGERGDAYPVALPSTLSTAAEVFADGEIDLRPTVRAAVLDRSKASRSRPSRRGSTRPSSRRPPRPSRRCMPCRRLGGAHRRRVAEPSARARAARRSCRACGARA